MAIGNDYVDRIDLSGISSLERRLATRVRQLLYILHKQGIIDGIMRIKLVCQNFKTLTVDEAKHQLNPEIFSTKFEEYQARKWHIHILHLVRNILSLFPLMLTWIGLALATNAYQEYGNHHSNDMTSFLLLWQHSFYGAKAFGFLSVPSFADIAVVDFSLLFLLVLSFIAIHYLEQHIQQVADQSCKELMVVLDDLVSFVRKHGTGRLLSPDDLKDLSDTITKAVLAATADRDKLVQDMQGYIGRSEQRITNLVKDTENQNKNLVHASNIHMRAMVDGTITQVQAMTDALKTETETIINQAKGEIVGLVEHTEEVVRKLIAEENTLHQTALNALKESLTKENALHQTMFDELKKSIAEEITLHQAMFDGLSQNIAKENTLHQTMFDELKKSIAEENTLHRTAFNGLSKSMTDLVDKSRAYIEAQTANIAQLINVMEKNFQIMIEIPINHLESVLKHFENDLRDVSSSAVALQNAKLEFSTELVKFGQWQRDFNGNLAKFEENVTSFTETSKGANNLISQLSLHVGELAASAADNSKTNRQIDAKLQNFGLTQQEFTRYIGDMKKIVNEVSSELREATQNLDDAAHTWLGQTKGEVNAMTQSVQSAANQISGIATHLSAIEQALQRIAPVFQHMAGALRNGGSANNQPSSTTSQQPGLGNSATQTTSASLPTGRVTPMPLPANPVTPAPLSAPAPVKPSPPRSPTGEPGAGMDGD